ncbi:MAG: hypothetical protein WC707_04465 [Candidatus Babeliaceae bacterium]|jgi:hypothetical protein
MNINKKNNIFFELNNNEKLVIELQDPLDMVFPCDDIWIKYLGKNSLTLSYDCLFYSLNQFTGMLLSATNNSLPLHPSINKDIGYLWNQELHGEPELLQEEHQGQLFWVGERYNLWSTPGDIRPKVTTWLYNDKNGDIIFEITPNYFWHFDEPTPDEDYITYEEFMKNYEPYVIRTIPHEVAQTWLEQASKLLEQVENNSKKHSPTAHLE